jgi:methylthioribulose-1-phosphate dehydratase
MKQIQRANERDGQRELPAIHPLRGYESLIDLLRLCGRNFYERGWSLATSSNYSVVLQNRPVELIITASGCDKGQLGRDDFVHIGADGLPTIDGQPKSSAETMLHVMLAEQDGVGAILHTHSVWGTLLSDYFCDAGGFELFGYEMLKGLSGVTSHLHRQWVQIFENSQNVPRLAQVVKNGLSHKDSSSNRDPLPHGFLIRNHGLYAWGRDIAEARRHVEVFEFLFECVGRKLAWTCT